MRSAVLYQSLEEIASVVRKFEGCEYSQTDFTHGLHLTVAAWYLWTFPPAEALNRMRSSLLRFTKHHNVNGYHETITRFWMLVAGAHIQEGSHEQDFAKQLNAMLARFSDKDTLFAHYSRERVMSDQARSAWVEPDLKPIPCNNPGKIE
jgi:hypothetical protein